MMKIIHPSNVLALAVFGILLITPLAQATDDIIQTLDRNSDGQISIKEAVANPRLLESFSRIDTDGNGFLTATELANTRIKGSTRRAKR